MSTPSSNQPTPNQPSPNSRGPKHRSAYINARIIDPASGRDGRGAILAEDGKISDLGSDLFADGVPEGIAAFDCKGAALIPGLVDLRVQLREPGDEHKETIESASRAAAAGGVTTMVALPNTDPIADDLSGIEYVARRARETKLVKVFSYAAITRGFKGEEMTEFGLLARAGAVGFSDGEITLADARFMTRALTYAKSFDKVIVQHPAEPSLSGGVMNGGELATRLGLGGIPPLAEVIQVERDIRLVEMTGGRLHFAHLTTAAAIDAVRHAKVRGLNITCDTAPHYFTLNESAVGDYRTFAKVMPPLRSEEDRAAVVEGLADGTIDAIASDHAPHDQDSKRLPFAGAEPGIVGLETLLPLSLALVRQERLSLQRLLRAMTNKPAEIFGLPAGRLQKGGPADFTLVDLDRAWQIDPARFQSKSKNSPFEKHPVEGQVLRTVVDGRTIFQASV